MPWLRTFIELIAALVIAGGVGGILYGVLKGNIAFSGRTIQFAAITCVLPAILILSLEHAVGGEGTMAIFGTVVGYALSVIKQTE